MSCTTYSSQTTSLMPKALFHSMMPESAVLAPSHLPGLSRDSQLVINSKQWVTKGHDAKALSKVSSLNQESHWYSFIDFCEEEPSVIERTEVSKADTYGLNLCDAIFQLCHFGKLLSASVSLPIKMRTMISTFQDGYIY